MLDENEIYCGFSCPHAGLDNEFLDLVVTEHARQTVEKFLECYGARLAVRGGGLEVVLTNWLQGTDNFETVWNSAFGEAFKAVFRNDEDQADDIDRDTAALALRLHECGHAGEWELQLLKPLRLRFGRWLLPSAREMKVSATQQAVTISTRKAGVWQRTAFQRTENCWEAKDVEALPVLSRPGIRWTILNAESLAPSSAALLKMEVFGFSDSDVDTHPGLLLRTCDMALEVIEQFGGDYLSWTSHAIRELIPLRAKSGIFSSGSIDLSPGVICLSNSISSQEQPWAFADVLVHEATHQHFYMARRLGRMDDGTDNTLYFSPFRNTGRPIYNILITYHAFANVLLFYRTALAHIGSTNQGFVLAIQERVRELEEKLQPLEQALQSTTSLTPLGLALWQPLQVRLQSAGAKRM